MSIPLAPGMDQRTSASVRRFISRMTRSSTPVASSGLPLSPKSSRPAPGRVAKLNAWLGHPLVHDAYRGYDVTVDHASPKRRTGVVPSRRSVATQHVGGTAGKQRA